jgi:RHS repeat-associated protein
MGRLASVTQPAADTVAWDKTTLVFEPVAASEYGVPAGHWRQTVSTGNARAITYLDAFWRPVLTRTYDTGNEANTAKMVLTKYDAGGMAGFVSYPQRSISSVTAAPDGTATSYDALGRPTSTTAASELGSLTTGYAYLTGFQKKTTNPRGVATTASYQAVDAPSEDAITKMVGAYSLTVNISRDIFGKPSAITRSGDNISATRSYVYDSNARLCKTIEPETGATVQAYDAANNTIWRASGLALPSTACDRTSVAAAKKISYTYDTLNRLTGTSYGDASPAITRTYTPDGLPLTNTSNGAVWTYTYNKRRLPTKESLAYAGKTYNIGWGYDANGSLAQLNYPDAANTAITYSPNALGEATAVSNYASSISYHPNGAIAGFTYANNIAHTMAQNTRGLPKQVTDAGVLDDIYTYDANGNVTGIQDMQENVTTRTMGYDDLDRLATANAANLWGNATFQNDALDNIVSSKITSGDTARTSSHYIDYATNRLTSIASTAGQYAFAYSYDSQGNITKRGAQAYVFDQGNRLASATGKATYSYDGLGRRVKIAKADGTTQIQVYSQSGQLLYGTTAVGAATPTESKYVYLGGTLLADIGVAYVHTDGLGSPVARTNSAKTILSLTRYEPYGLTAAGAQPTIGFTGHVNDVDTGLINMQQRYYDPVAGRFLSVDPVLTDANTGASFNRYNYANNSPYKYIDPDGREGLRPYDEMAGKGLNGLVEVMKAMTDAVKSNVPVPNVDGGLQNKTSINVGVIEVSHTINEGGSSTFIGMREPPALAIQNTTEVAAKVGDMSGITIKASGSIGIGKQGMSLSVAGSANTDSVGMQASLGMVKSSKDFSLGVKPPGVALGYTFKHSNPALQVKKDENKLFVDMDFLSLFSG